MKETHSFIDISISNVASCTIQSIHFAGHVIKSFNGAQVSSGQQLCNRISDSAASQFLGCRVSVYNFRADSYCFIRDGLASRHASCVYEFNSCGVTNDSETHYRGITALFSWIVPILVLITAVLPQLPLPCHLLVDWQQQLNCDSAELRNY